MPSTLTLRPCGRSSGPHPLQRLSLLLSCFLVACAQGPEIDELAGMGGFDAAVVVDAAKPVQDSGVSPAPAPEASVSSDTGVSGPVEDVRVGASDAGSPAAEDTSVAPVDTGTAPDTAVSTPLDAAADTAPPRDATPATDTSPATPETSTADAMPPTPQMCMATPSYPTTTACARCTCTRCAQQVATCYASNESAKNTQCAAVQACAEANKCIDRDCFCGKDTSDLACLSNQNGACRAVIVTAAGSDSALDVQRAGDDPQSPVGRSALIGACQLAQCRSECGL